jgi:cob(I)alamin adenosyltransferase
VNNSIIKSIKFSFYGKEVFHMEKLDWKDYLYRIKMDLIDVRDDLSKKQELQYQRDILNEDIEMLIEFIHNLNSTNEQLKELISDFKWESYKKYNRYE